MTQYIVPSPNNKSIRNVVARGLVLASLLVQMWPVGAAQAAR